MSRLANVGSAERTVVPLWRDELVRDVLSMAAALAVVAASLGAIAVSKGIPLWMVTLMGLLIFAGGSEFMAVGMMAAGASPVTTVL
ncbi:AzlC family ABC transporter permease, partial [Klebsiella pneumoniae]|nr:AzlC family ABC transporter permease [Klebsiella pneumoniae]